jgi:hypothetical protein
VLTRHPELPNAREIVRYMTAHAAMSSGVTAACDVLQTVITSRIKSVLPLQVWRISVLFGAFSPCFLTLC